MLKTDSFIDITENEKAEYNKTVNHPLQSFEWGEFRKKTEVKVIRRAQYKNNNLANCFTLTIHPIPHTPFTIGYLPKGDLPNKDLIEELGKIGKEKNCIFIQLEPNVLRSSSFALQASRLVPSARPLFTKYTLVLDLTKSEEELLKNMQSKTRYNIKIAKKHNVKVAEDNSEIALAEYLALMDETTKRQKFYAHTKNYHDLQYQSFAKDYDKNKLTYHLLNAKYKDEKGTTHVLTSWVLFVFHDTLYYPYGASAQKFRNTMSSNLVMWEAIRFGKKIGAKKFDMWGALGENPDPKDPWYGFHKFKLGYAPQLVEFIGSYDLIIDPKKYKFYKIADRLRWTILKKIK